MIIDIHMHLTDNRYCDKAAVVADFEINNGAFMIDCGYDDQTSMQTVENAQNFSNVFSAVGIHPEKASQINDEELKKLADLANNNKVVAIGEIGLDYHYDGFIRTQQLEAFEKQIMLADSLGLPFVVHSRDASKDVLDILRANKNSIKKGFLMHCYSESLEQAKNYLELGAYFSFGGVTTFKNAKKDEIIKSIPLDRLFCETDSPYLTPVPHRGELNYPSFVQFVYQKLESVLGVDSARFEEIMLKNATKLFPKISL